MQDRSGGEHQLGFQKGDVLYLINSEENNLFVVHRDTGMKGYIPRTSVTELLSKKRYSVKMLTLIVLSWSVPVYV